MFLLWVCLSFLVSLLAIALVLPGCVETYARYSRGRIVECPEEMKQATVSIAAGLAATTSAFLPTIRHIRECTLRGASPHCSHKCIYQLP